jgi:hypothetical protein
MLMQVDFLNGALPYAERLGWHVLPLTRLKKRPVLENGVYGASNDPVQIRHWGKQYPRSNLGAACGEASGFATLDIDPRDKGDEAIRALAAQGYLFPVSPRQRTGNNGWHLLFEYEPWMKEARGKLTKGVDFKKDGGFIVLAPSFTGPSNAGPGGLYRWEVSPFDVAIPKMPLWLKENLLPPPPPPRSAIATPGDIRRLVDHVADAKPGNRNNCLYWAARRAEEQGLLTSSAKQAFIAAATAAGEEKPKAVSTVNSAVRRQP